MNENVAKLLYSTVFDSGTNNPTTNGRGPTCPCRGDLRRNWKRARSAVNACNACNTLPARVSHTRPSARALYQQECRTLALLQGRTPKQQKYWNTGRYLEEVKANTGRYLEARAKTI